MMKTKRIRTILFGLFPTGLLIALIFKLTTVPNGVMLSGLFLGGIIIIGIIIGSLILTSLIKFIFKKQSFFSLMCITVSFALLLVHYQLYSPTLTITVPNGYTGTVHLVLSNVNENRLMIDTNGIGYITERTFRKTYTRPVVQQTDGKDLNGYLIGHTPSSFFGKTNVCCVGDIEFQSLSFTIGTHPYSENEYVERKNITAFIDPDKLIVTKSGNTQKQSTK